MYVLVAVSVVIVALYTTVWVRQFPCKGQFSFFPQLHVLSVVGCLFASVLLFSNMFLLCVLMIDLMFGVQL